MIDFNVGAWRQADDDTRAAQLAAANDLVTRTLAQHGLSGSLPGGSLPGSGGAQGAMPSGLSSAMSSMMAKLQTPGGATAAPPPLLDGASFDESSFTCAAGTRRYLTYVPASAAEGLTGVVVMLHGCTQTPADFAAGTGMNALAETHRFLVVYPAQSRGDNAQSCWNWFSKGDQRRDRGEPAILAGLTQEVIARHKIPEGRAFVAGLSAGAAMAVILGGTYPDLFQAVGAHSGLPAGAAHDVASAFAAMGGREAASTPRSRPTRTIVFHGSADGTVTPSNADRIVQQALGGSPRETVQTEDTGTTGGRTYRRTTTATATGAALVEQWVVEGMGHAWSGGQAAGSYTDPQGPDASAEMVRFFFEEASAG